MLCDPTVPVPISSLLRLQILTLDLSVPLTLGVPLILHHQQKCEPVVLSKLVGICDSSTGAVIQANPRSLGSQKLGIVQVKLDRPLCVETYDQCRALGRVTLRRGIETVAVGKIVGLDDV